MASSPIHAVDQRTMPFASDQIWSVLADVNGYASWYPRSLNLKVQGVTAVGVGSEVELCPKGGRPFRCRLEAMEPPRRMRFRYPGEFIVGDGEWRLETAGNGTTVTYEMNVAAHGLVVVWLGKLLPLGKLHSKFMREVLENLEHETVRRSGSDRAARV